MPVDSRVVLESALVELENVGARRAAMAALHQLLAQEDAPSEAALDAAIQCLPVEGECGEDEDECSALRSAAAPLLALLQLSPCTRTFCSAHIAFDDIAVEVQQAATPSASNLKVVQDGSGSASSHVIAVAPSETLIEHASRLGILHDGGKELARQLITDAARVEQYYRIGVAEVTLLATPETQMDTRQRLSCMVRLRHWLYPQRR